jgi:hypothetical protein
MSVHGEPSHLDVFPIRDLLRVFSADRWFRENANRESGKADDIKRRGRFTDMDKAVADFESAMRKTGLRSIGPGDYRWVSDNLEPTLGMNQEARHSETTEVALNSRTSNLSDTKTQRQTLITLIPINFEL